MRELGAERVGLSETQLHPAPLLSSADLAELGVPRGPRWGELLRACEELQLAAELSDREAALEWVRVQARAD